MKCYTGSAAWSADGDLEVGQQLVCSGSLMFDQDTMEAGDFNPEAFVIAENLVLPPAALPFITVVNRPSLTVTVDPTTCMAPSRAGMRAGFSLGCASIPSLLVLVSQQGHACMMSLLCCSMVKWSSTVEDQAVLAEQQHRSA